MKTQLLPFKLFNQILCEMPHITVPGISTSIDLETEVDQKIKSEAGEPDFLAKTLYKKIETLVSGKPIVLKDQTTKLQIPPQFVEKFKKFLLDEINKGKYLYLYIRANASGDYTLEKFKELLQPKSENTEE